MKIIVINGAPCSGKDAFAAICHKYITWCGNISTVDFVKEVAVHCGWNGTKTPKDRKFLSDLKDLLTEWNDVPFQKVRTEINKLEYDAMRFHIDSDEVVCFIHCREPQEIQKFVDRLGAKTLLLRRPDVENNEQSNHADSQVLNYDYDYTIVNDGTLLDLELKAIDFLLEIGCKNLKPQRK